MILIDTTPLVALCDARDAKHRLAKKHLELLAANEFAVCDAVLTEACFHLPYRSQRQRLRALLQALEIDPLAVTCDRTFWLEVFAWLRVVDQYKSVSAASDREEALPLHSTSVC